MTRARLFAFGACLAAMTGWPIAAHLQAADHGQMGETFPIIADIDMKVAKLYGMLHENTSNTAAVRAVFFIDPAGIIRLIMYYPLNVGRNMEEIMRVLEAMQTVDVNACAMPVNWKKGDKVIVPPPKTLKDLDARIKDTTLEKVDFYLAKKQLA